MNKFTLHLTAQVSEYIATLPPDVKKQFRRELEKLSVDDGDKHPLKDELDGFWRLRIGKRRMIYRHIGGMNIECAFAGERATIYQIFVPPKADEKL